MFCCFSFAIDSSIDVMNILDQSVTEVGNDVLSDMDVQKVQCLYQCDGCGGHQFGDSGILDTSGESSPDSCKWLLRTEQGFGIRLTLDEFEVNISNRFSFSIICSSSLGSL